MQRTTELEAKIKNSVEFASDLLRGKDTGHKVITKKDNWEAIGPGGRLKLSPRDYTVITPKGQSISESWTVFSHTDQGGSTIKPVLNLNGEKYLVYVYIPRPSTREWLLEFPAGGITEKDRNKAAEELFPPYPTEELLANRAARVAAVREVEEETGFKPGSLTLIMPRMSHAAFRFDRFDRVFTATDLSKGTRKPDFEEKPMEVHILPVSMLIDLLRKNIITDFRTAAITADHLLFGDTK